MNGAGLLVDALIALNLGLVSQVHCVGMCGGVVGALAFAVDPKQVARRGMLPFALAYNAGRVTSYVGAGVLLGFAGGEALALWPGAQAHLWLRVAAGAVLIVAGLSLLGVGGPGAWLERLGQRLWRVIARPGRRLLPLASLPAAWAFGLLWGWLPCALVYATLLFAATGADALRAGVVMLAFGLGTSPALILAATLSRRGGGLLRKPAWRRAGGVVLIVVGLAYPLLDRLTGGHAGHSGHTGHGLEQVGHDHHAPAPDHAPH
ncbi:MAG: sulfite exporter TauE/SafE family protein [Gammaproteobacteria bacterium]